MKGPRGENGESKMKRIIRKERDKKKERKKDQMNGNKKIIRNV